MSATNEFKVKGEELLQKIKQLIREGNVSRIIIKDDDGRTFLEIPVTIGVVGAIFAPVLAAVGALAARRCNQINGREVVIPAGGEPFGPLRISNFAVE